jgi:hypothetical protein
MFMDATHDVIGHAEIERAVLLAGQEIDVKCHLGLW